MAKAMDRRAARTRRALHEALIALILRKGYEAVTIQDIIDEADIGRSTFYAHYSGKEDLLRSGFEQLRTLLEDEAGAARAEGDWTDGRGSAAPLGFSLALFEHACAYRQVYRALVGGRGATVAINEIRRILADRVREDLPEAGDDGAVPRELRVQFVVGAFMTVLTWCLERRHGLRPPEMDTIFRRLVLGGIGPARPAIPAAAPGADG